MRRRGVTDTRPIGCPALVGSSRNSSLRANRLTEEGRQPMCLEVCRFPARSTDRTRTGRSPRADIDRPGPAPRALLRQGSDESEDPPGGRHRRRCSAGRLHEGRAHSARNRSGRVRLPDATQLPAGDGGRVPADRRAGDRPSGDRLHEFDQRRPGSGSRALRARAHRGGCRFRLEHRARAREPVGRRRTRLAARRSVQRGEGLGSVGEEGKCPVDPGQPEDPVHL